MRAIPGDGVYSEDERDYVEYVTARLPALHRTACLLCGDAHRADDIVQATLAALYRYWPRARTTGGLDAYVHRILVRKYLDEKRLRWARVRLMPTLPDAASIAPGAGIEDRDTLRTALAKLPRAQRAVLVLRFACDLPVDEVAEMLHCSPGTVKNYTARGLAALRRVLGVDPARRTP
jgi:RNA polymerase sigma-70 factor (sigma-E family)